ncbi:MAG TPA: phosphoribosylanthranilate isomerase [Methanobacteriaceae archaeon]|nr:phosphoribosylanthranilate isomerase [Methanobacteriaceae archaeon]
MNNSPETRAMVYKGLKEDVQENSFQKTSIHTLNEKNKGYGELKSCKNELMVKICGITRANDLKCVESQGSDYIGFINVKRSPRFCEIDKIKGLVGLLADKNRAVLVLEPENPSEAFNKIKSSEIFNIQLHSLDLSELRDLKNKINSLISNNSEEGYFKINIIRAIGLSDIIDESKKREIQSFSEICDALLFDYQMQGKSGGTGKQIPLDLAIKASKIARNTNRNIKIFLAGGMDRNRMKTEGKIISKFFDVVDFNSSLEDAPGIKNKEKIKKLMNLLKEFNWRCKA